MSRFVGLIDTRPVYSIPSGNMRFVSLPCVKEFLLYSRDSYGKGTGFKKRVKEKTAKVDQREKA
jgi:hypothetical protein